jgi:hypothetical protein
MHACIFHITVSSLMIIACCVINNALYSAVWFVCSQVLALVSAAAAHLRMPATHLKQQQQQQQQQQQGSGRRLPLPIGCHSRQ